MTTWALAGAERKAQAESKRKPARRFDISTPLFTLPGARAPEMIGPALPRRHMTDDLVERLQVGRDGRGGAARAAARHVDGAAHQRIIGEAEDVAQTQQ